MSSSVILWMTSIYAIFCWWPVIIVPLTRSDIRCRRMYHRNGYHSSWDLTKVLVMLLHVIYGIVAIAIVFFTVVCACVGYIVHTFTV